MENLQIGLFKVNFTFKRLSTIYRNQYTFVVTKHAYVISWISSNQNCQTINFKHTTDAQPLPWYEIKNVQIYRLIYPINGNPLLLRIKIVYFTSQSSIRVIKIIIDNGKIKHSFVNSFYVLTFLYRLVKILFLKKKRLNCVLL